MSIRFENTEVFNFEGALRGMRNPLNSWDKSNSGHCEDIYCDKCRFQHENCDHINSGGFVLGQNDLELAKKLVKAGTDYRKFLRQIMVSVDIIAPSFWWPEFDTYKVGTVRNSCSKMHTIHVKEFVKEDFSTEGIDALWNVTTINFFKRLLSESNWLREMFNETKDKRYWRALLELLPHGYDMRATITLNYEVLANIYHSRKNHKLDEWSVGFISWIESLPYAEELIIGE